MNSQVVLRVCATHVCSMLVWCIVYVYPIEGRLNGACYECTVCYIKDYIEGLWYMLTVVCVVCTVY